MKKILLSLVIAVSILEVRAQYCWGNPSGFGQCTHHGVAAPTGITPVSDSIPPFQNGVFSEAVFQVRFNHIQFGGQLLTVEWFRIDSIGNLPAGLCWATDTVNNTFDSTGGCIKISGTPCGYTGQYGMKIIFTAWVGVPIPTTADVAGYKQFLRLKNSGDIDIPVDTTQSLSNPILFYGNTILGCTPTLCQAFYSLYPDSLIPHQWWAVNLASGNMPLTYLWQWGDGSGSTGATPSHIYSAPGNYNICLTVSDNFGCSDSYCDSSTYIYKTDGIATVDVVWQIPTGISQSAIPTPQFAITPNPATNSVTISIDESMIGGIVTVSDITGRKVAAVPLSTVNCQLSTESFSSGVYFVTLTSKGRNSTKKLLISR